MEQIFRNLQFAEPAQLAGDVRSLGAQFPTSPPALRAIADALAIRAMADDQLIHACVLAVAQDEIAFNPDATVRAQRLRTIDTAAVELGLSPAAVLQLGRKAAEILDVFKATTGK